MRMVDWRLVDSGLDDLAAAPRQLSCVPPESTNPPILESSNQPGAACGFTLIEILTVVAIMAVLMGLVLGIAGFVSKKGDVSRARAELALIKNALEEYRIEYGRYPTNTVAANSSYLVANLWVKPQAQGKKPLLVIKGWQDPNTAYRVLDPWGNDYRYYYDANPDPSEVYASNNNSKFGYDLWSLGPDALSNYDDIANWKGDF